MATEFVSDRIGNADEAVRIVLNKDDLFIATGWTVQESVLEQPSSWSLNVGWGGVVKDFLAKYPTGTPFQLFVGGALQSTGYLEGRRVHGTGEGAATIELKGRDTLGVVYKSHVQAQTTLINPTYLMLVWRALAACGVVTGSAPDTKQLQTTNEANRQVKAGRPIKQLKPPRSVDQIIEDTDSGVEQTAGVSHQIQANVGENWLSFLRRYLDPAGLTLWAAADGTFVLSAPNTAQAALYQIRRQANGENGLGNVTSYDFSDDTARRHTECVVYGRGGGRKAGRTKASGTAVDEEMANIAIGPPYLPRLDPRTVLSERETNCQNTEQAENYAFRKLAEERRDGFQLHYTIPGHTLPVVGGGQAIVTVDTIVAVQDDELGISGNFYVDSLVRRRSPETSTDIRLVRATDIVIAAP